MYNSVLIATLFCSGDMTAVDYCDIWSIPAHAGEPMCTVSPSNLHSGLRELRPLSQLLPGVDVWVMRPLKSFLQLLQLLSREGGAAASLFPLQGQVWLRVHIRSIIYAITWGAKKNTGGCHGDDELMTSQSDLCAICSKLEPTENSDSDPQLKMLRPPLSNYRIGATLSLTADIFLMMCVESLTPGSASVWASVGVKAK